jgi:DNA polymerase-3 subunit beta
MKFEVSKVELQKELKIMAPIYVKMSSMPILSTVLLNAQDDRLTLQATDLEISLTTSITAKIFTDGVIAVPGKLFSDVINSITTEAVRLELLENDSLKITAGNFSTKLFGYDPYRNDFPRFPDANETEFHDIPADALIDAINKTYYSVTASNNNYNLSGICWTNDNEKEDGELVLVSTDSNRLNFVKLEGVTWKLDTPFIVSQKGLLEVKYLAEKGFIDVGLEGSHFVARAGATVLFVRTVEGQFPDYKKLLPTPIINIGLNKQDILGVMNRMKLFTSNRYKVVYFKLNNGTVEFSTLNPEIGEAEEILSIDYPHEELIIGFEPKLITDILKPLKSEEAIFSITDAKTPVLVTGTEDPTYTGILTTVKIV